MTFQGLKYPRAPKPGERVQVFYNLNRSCWSVREPRTGRTLCHVQECSLSSVSWVVRPGGRRKTIETGQKRIHAFGVGAWEGEQASAGCTIPVTYNPFRFETFVHAHSLEPLHSSSCACFNSERKAFAKL